jgi:hypothetical protein
VSYSRQKTVNFGKARAGLATVGYKFLPGGARITAGVAEIGTATGCYGALVTITSGFVGAILWDTGGASPVYAAEEINPGTDEYSDVAVSSRSTYAGTASPATSSTAAAWSALASVYCTDEDIALRCLGDYPALCPDHQKLAAGTDGVFLSADRWKLTSATVDFTAAGVHAGNVVQLTAPRAQFRNDGELFIVESVGSDGAATLRRLGKGAGVGQPPAPAAGLTGVAFEVLTLDPQIEQATYEIQQWMGVDTTYPDRTPYDPRSLNLLCVLWVLQRMYALQARKREEDFGLKLEQIKEELEDLKGRLSIRWGPRGLSGRAGGVFGARAGR